MRGALGSWGTPLKGTYLILQINTGIATMYCHPCSLSARCEGPRNARSQIFTKVKLLLQSNAGYYIVAQKYHKNTKTQCMLTIVRSAAPAAQPRLPP